jgi:hypothetical protein
MDARNVGSTNPRAKVVDLEGYRLARDRDHLPLFEDNAAGAPPQPVASVSLSERQVAHRTRMLAHLRAHR